MLDREVASSGLAHLDGFALEIGDQKRWIDHLVAAGNSVYLIQIGDGVSDEVIGLTTYASVFQAVVPEDVAVTPIVVAPWIEPRTPVGVRSPKQARKLLLRLRSDPHETSRWTDMRDRILKLIMAQQRAPSLRRTA